MLTTCQWTRLVDAVAVRMGMRADMFSPGVFLF